MVGIGSLRRSASEETKRLNHRPVGLKNAALTPRPWLCECLIPVSSHEEDDEARAPIRYSSYHLAVQTNNAQQQRTQYLLSIGSNARPHKHLVVCALTVQLYAHKPVYAQLSIAVALAADEK